MLAGLKELDFFFTTFFLGLPIVVKESGLLYRVSVWDTPKIRAA